MAIPTRYQTICRPPHKRHRYNLENVCIFCGAPRITGAQRMAHYRQRLGRDGSPQPSALKLGQLMTVRTSKDPLNEAAKIFFRNLFPKS
jgi:hypothetical protein